VAELGDVRPDRGGLRVAAISAVAAPDSRREQALKTVQASLASVVQFLGEWRNAYGSGHGKRSYQPGLKPITRVSRPMRRRRASGSSSRRSTTCRSCLRETKRLQLRRVRLSMWWWPVPWVRP
jgi:hypothetical protein